jgi:DNA-directed RNA polymerase specialized sigma24 family protein
MNDRLHAGLPEEPRGDDRFPDSPDWRGVLGEVLGPRREQALEQFRVWLDEHKSADGRDGLRHTLSGIFHDQATPEEVKGAALELLLESSRELIARRARYHGLSSQVVWHHLRGRVSQERETWDPGVPFVTWCVDLIDRLAPVLRQAWNDPGVRKILDWTRANRGRIRARGRRAGEDDLGQEVIQRALQALVQFQPEKGVDMSGWLAAILNSTQADFDRRRHAAPMPFYVAVCPGCGKGYRRRQRPDREIFPCRRKGCDGRCRWEQNGIQQASADSCPDPSGEAGLHALQDGEELRHWRARLTAALAGLHPLDLELFTLYHLPPDGEGAWTLDRLAEHFSGRAALEEALKQYFPKLEDYHLDPSRPADGRRTTVYRWLRKVQEKVIQLCRQSPEEDRE